MLLPSERAKDIGASPIRSLLPHAYEAKKNGKHIFHLNIGQPDIATPTNALERVANLKESIVSYGPSEGLPALRTKVAEYYDKFDADIDQENVYVTTGASEAILFTLLATCDNHDEVIIPEPFYANYLGFAHLTNVNIVPITTDLESKFSLPAPSEFEKLVTSKTKAIFLCNPTNPTGQMYTAAQLEELMAIVKKYNLYLIVDEVYREFCYDHAFTSVLSFKGVDEHVVVIDSISKVFSSCGARVGYLISKNESFLQAVNKYAQLRLCPPYFGQQLALACYDEADKYIAEAKEEYMLRREELYAQLNSIPNVKCYKPMAAFYNIAELPVDDAEKFCKWLLTDFEYKGSTVMLAPANGFYFTKNLGKQQVRIAYILNREDLKSAMECLKVALEQYPG